MLGWARHGGMRANDAKELPQPRIELLKAISLETYEPSPAQQYCPLLRPAG